MHSSPTFFTIIARNYLAQAITLSHSIRRFYPEAEIYVALADRVPAEPLEKSLPFRWIPIESLGIERLAAFCFKYGTLELATAIKPHAFKMLFNDLGCERVIYLDPDIRLLNRLTPVERALAHHSIILTPHLLQPLLDSSGPRELDILRAGTFNLGFLALSRSKTTMDFIEWWQDRLGEGCRMEIERGMHVDQRWMDLVPSYFPDFHILRDPGMNIAYWNLRHRRLTEDHGGFLVGNEPAYFFHFSGFDPQTPDVFSRHFYPQCIIETADLSRLHHAYAATLIENGYEIYSKLSPAFSRFDNGASISAAMRLRYIDMTPTEREEFGNPFTSQRLGSLYRQHAKTNRNFFRRGTAKMKRMLKEMKTIGPREIL